MHIPLAMAYWCISTHTKTCYKKHGALTGSFPVIEILYKMQQSKYLVPMTKKKKSYRQKLNSICVVTS